MELEEIKTLINTVCELLSGEKLTESIATFYWNSYQALKKKGFEPREALEILLNFRFNPK